MAKNMKKFEGKSSEECKAIMIEECKEWFEKADSDKDGKLSCDEWCNAIESDMKKMKKEYDIDCNMECPK